MSERHYYLDLSGRPLEGYKVDDVAEALARLLRVPPQKARSMLRGRSFRIRRDLEEAQALRLMKKVIACGAQCDMTPVPAEVLAETLAAVADEQSLPPDPELELEHCEDEKPQPLDLELERIEDDSPAPVDTGADATAVDGDATERTNAFERLNRAALASEPAVPTANAETGATAPAAVAAAEVSAVQGEEKRRLMLLVVAATLAVAAAIGGWFFLQAPDAPVVAEKPADQVPVENATTRTQRHMRLFARSVRIWMIQYGAGFDPAQVTAQRMQQDLAIEPGEMRDGWGTPLRYLPLEEKFSIVSAGPDTEFDTGDDLMIEEQARE